jgi:hypothetical protein
MGRRARRPLLSESAFGGKRGGARKERGISILTSDRLSPVVCAR